MLKIGSLRLQSPFLQAPMAGFSNDAWRRILLKFGGVGLLASEMMHARGSLEMERRRKTLHGRLFGLPLREKGDRSADGTQNSDGTQNTEDPLRRFAQNGNSRNRTFGKMRHRIHFVRPESRFRSKSGIISRNRWLNLRKS